MKEVKEWNGKPRMMWCWDTEGTLHKSYVTLILTEEQLKESNAIFPVIAVGSCYSHCAEIEEEKPCTVYVLNFYDCSFDEFDEENLYFSSLEKLDAFMDAWDKGIAEVGGNGNLKGRLCHYYMAEVLEVEIDSVSAPKSLYTYVKDKDGGAYHWHKAKPNV